MLRLTVEINTQQLNNSGYVTKPAKVVSSVRTLVTN